MFVSLVRTPLLLPFLPRNAKEIRDVLREDKKPSGVTRFVTLPRFGTQVLYSVECGRPGKTMIDVLTI